MSARARQQSTEKGGRRGVRGRGGGLSPGSRGAYVGTTGGGREGRGSSGGVARGRARAGDAPASSHVRHGGAGRGAVPTSRGTLFFPPHSASWFRGLVFPPFAAAASFSLMLSALYGSVFHIDGFRKVGPTFAMAGGPVGPSATRVPPTTLPI